MSKHHVTATVNGDEVEFLCETQETLLDVLRNTLTLTGAKEGCGSGDCGACSVTVDGRLMCSCLVLGVEAQGKKIETIEGMAKGDELHPLQRKFLEHAALQCGICTPGFLIAATVAAGEEQQPDGDRGPLLSGRQPLPLHGLRQDHQGRDGYGRRDEESLIMQEKVKVLDHKYVGTRPIRPDGMDKVTGRARFGADYNLPGQLVGKVLRSPHPHAKLISIDTSKAEKLPGVKAVVCRDDFPEMPSEVIPAGEMLMNYRDVTRNVMAREKVLYEGHPVAAVAATSEAIAKQALKLIEVKYEVLPHVIDVLDAMKPDAPVLHADLFTQGVVPVGKSPSPADKVFKIDGTKASNIAKRLEIGHGDIDAGFAKADLVVERIFNTQPVHQGYIEPHACIATATEDGNVDV